MSTFFSSVLGNVIVTFSSLLLVTAFIRKISKDADEDLNPTKRDDIALYLMGLKESGIPIEWMPNFILVFDKFFGKKHFKINCFYKSAIISILMYIIVSFLLVGMQVNLDEHLFSYILLIGGLAILINIPIDYVSLLQTRIIIGLKLNTLAKIIIDNILTYIIFCTIPFVAFYAYAFITNKLNSENLTFQHFFSFYEMQALLIYDYLSNPEIEDASDLLGTQIFAVSLITTFTTTIWLWLHGLAEFTIKLLSPIPRITDWLDIEKSPIRSIGIIINLYIWLFGLVIIALKLTF